MRTLRLLWAVIALMGFQKIQSQGIVFEHGAWDETLQKAQKSGKMIFLDAYTTWCGPCKLLTRNTFPDSAVGVFFNDRFINAKMDMERGEGVKLAERYGVNVYPTLLFIDGSGNMVHRAVGYHLPAQLLDLGKKALDPTTQIGGLHQQYNSGERAPEFLLRYLESLTAAYDPQAGPVANQYLATQKDLSTPANLQMIAMYADDPMSEAFKYMISHREIFDQKFGKEFVEARIQTVFDQYVMLHPRMEWSQIESLIRSVYPVDSDKKVSLFKMNWLKGKEDVPGFLEAAFLHYTKFESDNADELNEIAWIFYKNSEDKTYLKQALKWAERSVSIYESYYNVDTVAALQAKLGQKKQAIKSAKRAIELAQQAGEDASATQQLLDELNK